MRMQAFDRLRAVVSRLRGTAGDSRVLRHPDQADDAVLVERNWDKRETGMNQPSGTRFPDALITMEPTTLSWRV